MAIKNHSMTISKLIWDWSLTDLIPLATLLKLSTKPSTITTAEESIPVSRCHHPNSGYFICRINVQKKGTWQLVIHIDEIKLHESELVRYLKQDIDKFHRLRDEVLNQEIISGKLIELDYDSFNHIGKDKIKEYLIYILKFGTAEERLKVMSAIKTRFILHNKELAIKS